MYTRPSLSDVLPAPCVFLAAGVTPRFGSQAQRLHPMAAVKDEGGLAMPHSKPRPSLPGRVDRAECARNPRTAGPPCADVCMSASRNVTSCARVRVVRDRTRLRVGAGCRGAIAAREHGLRDFLSQWASGLAGQADR